MSRNGTHWRAEDDSQIEDAIRNNLELTQIRALFPSRTFEAVRHRVIRARRGIRATNPRPNHQPAPTVVPQTPDVDVDGGQLWTADEIETLHNATQNGFDVDHLRTLFPDRSADAPKRRYRRASHESSPKTVSKPAKKNQYVNWTTEDDERIRDAVRANLDRGAIRAMFPTRSVDAVRTRITKVSKTMGSHLQNENPESGPSPVAHEDTVPAGQHDNVEPLTPSLSAEELSEIEYSSDDGDLSYERTWENSLISGSNGWPHTTNSGWDPESYLLPETHAFLAETSPGFHSVSNATQTQNHHPELPQDSLVYDELAPLNAPFMPIPEHLESGPVDNGYGDYQLSMDDHPDLRNGLDFTPVPHQPFTPPGFVTSEQLFADPSALPSAFMPLSPVHNDHVFDMMMDFPPEDVAGDMVPEGDEMEE